MLRKFLLILCLFIWVFLHLPEIFYATEGAMFPSFVGDEQSPVNGALHILEERNPLGLRNHETLYYGPVFSIIALPAIISDYAFLLASGKVHNALEYKQFLLWDWGGILWKTRLIATVFGFCGLVAFFFLLNTETINPSRNKYLPFIGTLVLSINFLFFEYAAFFRHWVFMVSIFIIQFYFLIKIVEDGQGKKRYWMYEIALALVSFGIDYVSIFLQLMWLPVLIKWGKERKFFLLRQFLFHAGFVLVGAMLIVWWHPFAFLRMVGFVQTGTMAEVPHVGPREFSYFYYARTLWNNLFPLFPLWILMVGHLVYAKRVYRVFWFWVPVIIGFFSFAFFGFFDHHETRYVLPVVVAFLVSFFSLLVYYAEYFFSKKIWKIVFILALLFTVVYHSLGISLVNNKFYSHGVGEKSLIAMLTERQRENKNFSALIVGEDMFSVPHTKAAYVNYVRECGKEGVRTYDEIINAEPPTAAISLNVYYYCRQGEPNKEERSRYDAVIYALKSPVEVGYFDFDMSYLLFLEDYSTRYVVVSPKNSSMQ